MSFVENFARFFRAPILYLIIVCYAKEGVLKNPAKIPSSTDLALMSTQSMY